MHNSVWLPSSILSFFLLHSLPTQGQTSVLQDKGGETSLSVLSQPLVVNAAAASITANINRGWAIDGNERFVGMAFSLKADEGIATLLDGYTFKPDYKLSAYYQFSLPNSTDSEYRAIYVAVAYARSYFSLLKSDNSNTFEQRLSNKPQLKVGYNWLTKIAASPVLLGLTLDVGPRDNLDNLKPVLVYTTQVVSQLTQLTDKKAGYSGVYRRATALRLNLDSYLYPQAIGGRTGLGGYLRAQTGNTAKTDAGLGVILGQKDAPAKVVVGAFYQFGDIFDQLNTEGNLLKRSGINLVAGYVFAK